jgi:hypothetical protein
VGTEERGHTKGIALRKRQKEGGLSMKELEEYFDLASEFQA